MARKPTKGERRVQRHQQRKTAARTGRQLLDVAWDWLLAEMTALKDVNPGKADQACRNLAEQIEQIAHNFAEEAAREADVAVR